MLTPIAQSIWHVQRNFKTYGIPLSSRMTVVRLNNGGLWLHSPVQLNSNELEELKHLGPVRYIVAPNKTHHLFVSDYLAEFPDAKLFGAPRLRSKRRDLTDLNELKSSVEEEWQDDLDQVFFSGIPLLNETVWFHKPSRTLIMTDVCQWWQGDLPWMARIYASLTDVRKQLAVPKTIRSAVKDHQAARLSADQILTWPIERVVVAHNAIIEEKAHSAVEKAFACFGV